MKRTLVFGAMSLRKRISSDDAPIPRLRKVDIERMLGRRSDRPITLPTLEWQKKWLSEENE